MMQAKKKNTAKETSRENVGKFLNSDYGEEHIIQAYLRKHSGEDKTFEEKLNFGERMLRVLEGNGRSVGIKTK